MRRALLFAALLAVPLSAQAPDPVGLVDILAYQYGDRIEWVIDDGAIVRWDVMSGAETPRPTPTEIAAMLVDADLLALVRAANRQRWRPTVDAMCAELGCDAAAVWALAQTSP